MRGIRKIAAVFLTCAILLPLNGPAFVMPVPPSTNVTSGAIATNVEINQWSFGTLMPKKSPSVNVRLFSLWREIHDDFKYGIIPMSEDEPAYFILGCVCFLAIVFLVLNRLCRREGKGSTVFARIR